MTTNIPLLSIRPSADEVREYLKWLAASPYAYHIDDNPEDLLLPHGIEPQSSLDLAVLRWNSDHMWAAFDSNQLWEWYAPSDSYQMETTEIPAAQTDIIIKALEFYISAAKKMNINDAAHFELFDMQTLAALMKYPVTVEVPKRDKQAFASLHGIDFPKYL